MRSRLRCEGSGQRPRVFASPSPLLAVGGSSLESFSCSEDDVGEANSIPIACANNRN